MSTSTKQVFLWHGDNDYAIRKKISQWLELFQKKYTGLNVVKLDALEFSRNQEALIAELKNSFQVNSLFGSNKLLVLRNFLVASKEKSDTPKKKTDKNTDLVDLLLESLEKLPATFFVVFWQGTKADTRLKLFKALAKLEKSGSAEIEEFELPKVFALPAHIKKEITARKATITDKAAEILGALTGADLWQIETEIEKLIHYANGRTITDKDVVFLVKGKYNDNIFALTDALGARNKKLALNLISDQLNSGANEIYLFTMLTRQFRQLRQIKELMESDNITDKNVIAKELGLHPFVAQKAIEQARYFSLNDLKVLTGKLLIFEHTLKTKNHGFRVLFDKFVAEL